MYALRRKEPIFMYIMYTCVLREETNCYAAHYYITFNITSVALSSFFFLVLFFLFTFYFTFFFEFIPLFSELIVFRRLFTISRKNIIIAKRWSPHDILNAKKEQFSNTMERSETHRTASFLTPRIFNIFRSLNTSTNQICVLISENFQSKKDLYSLYKEYYFISVRAARAIVEFVNNKCNSLCLVKILIIIYQLSVIGYNNRYS